MKKLLLFLFALGSIANAQEKWTTNKGLLTFEASVPIFEAVAAINNNVICVLNRKKTTVEFVVPISKFHFERSLMEQHFNENYLESKKYPKAIFKGIIENFDLEKWDNTTRNYFINGTITIHGKSQKISVTAQIKNSDKQVELTSDFTLNTDDYNIIIPYLVRSKISKNVAVHLEMLLQ